MSKRVAVRKELAGTAGGAVAGRAAGMAIGSVVPVIGTAIGGVVGGAIERNLVTKPPIRLVKPTVINPLLIK